MIRKFINRWEVLITIIISITSIFLGVKANEMTKIQTEVAKNSSLPNIQVTEKEIIDEQTETAYDSVIKISNLDGRINNYSSRVVTFLKCSYLDEKDNLYEKEVPIFNYYIIGNKSGEIKGVLEEKTTGKNREKIIDLLKKIIENNKNGETSLYAEVNSYVCVSYIDILGKEQEMYYITDMFDSQMIDEEEGKNKFKIYDKLSEENIGINPNRNENIKVEMLIKKIYDISKLNIEEKEKKNIQRKETFNAMTEILGVFLAAFLTYILWRIQENKRDRGSKSHASSILFYDLKSIETYINNERSSINLRYSAEWQQMIANCSFLKDEQVKNIYNIYDKVYNYNYSYNLVENTEKEVRKEDIPQYGELKNIFEENSEENKKYREILEELRKHIILKKE